MDDTFIRVIAQPAVEPACGAWRRRPAMTHRNLPGRDGQRRAPGNTRAQPARAVPAGSRPSDNIDTLLALAREAGLLVTLDGQIGREKYQSVAGSVLALQRFAAALCARAAPDVPAVAEPRRKAQPHVQLVRTAARRPPAPAGEPRRGPAARPALDASHDLSVQAATAWHGGPAMAAHRATSAAAAARRACTTTAHMPRPSPIRIGATARHHAP
jgi:hypothetical protein